MAPDTRSTPASGAAQGRALAARPAPWPTVFVALVIAALYLPVLVHAMAVWSSDQEFSFGFLVPPIAAALAWQRRRDLCKALRHNACERDTTGESAGLPLLAAGLLLLVIGARTGINVIGGASFLATALGAAAYLYGTGAARALFFPAAVFTLGLSLYRGLLNSVGFALQGLTAHYAAALATLLGLHVRRSGVDLFEGRLHFVVAEACSGLSSLLALLCLGLVVCGLLPFSPARRVALLCLIVPIVLAANVVRVTAVLALARAFGLAVAHGFIHGFFSAALFLVALALLGLAGSVLRWSPPTAVTAS